MKALYLIPARGGSKGIPHKNIKPLNGKPLINYSIDIARKFVEDKDICVSTDDLKIKEVAEEYGLKVPFLRPDELASDTSTTSDVIVHALNYYESLGIKYDAVVLLQPTSPLRKENDVKNALDLYNDSLDMVTTVKKSYVAAVLCEETPEGYIKDVFIPDTRRQDAKPLYEYNGAVYVINAKSVKEKGLAGLTKIKKSVMSDENSVDIDTMLDWYIVEALMNKKVENE